MSNVIAQPEVLAAAGGKLHTINEALKAGNAAADAATVRLMPAAGDLVSALTALQFAAHAQLYQTVSAHALTAQPIANSMGGVPVVGGRGVQFAAPRYGFKPTVVPRPPVGG